MTELDGHGSVTPHQIVRASEEGRSWKSAHHRHRYPLNGLEIGALAKRLYELLAGGGAGLSQHQVLLESGSGGYRVPHS
jgi:hypothetical protein